ncbi:C-X-C motif chemokine 13 [Panthera pardus]|uniref:C-X-C motif chemokine n=8 Tax=Felidae TaxID=9681 RepID=A0ABI7ZNV4_FELCA|nr:C-X-C motif chemokine 13 [Felis catus]XP_007074854.2 C-X-C motif chemokine 13 isoform X2 [Panthera tigris]XP_014929859.1 C-X-C motif chemokine 13 [Acinonyx jubatus]XP_019322302.1 C-X-C motif chemokine 13 [Panthera pardus]XP_025778145.1 C-X-C motif chemokine 13 [Puma concolor]XP_030169488.1 C-X-C motif chemokine 13 [Lynx canadensis]XP_040336469.1 C-X-C motif chemokine 13 [Puma yagouaroundi]XP_042789924.1 C-X-C motif chemokine 13 isoform X2 [Panthera leo]XP_043428345.1 C-X-C motif chemokin
MRFSLGFLLLMLLVYSITPVHGVLEAFNTNLKCKCVQETSAFIPIQLIEKLQVLPPGNGCPNKEIIVWKKNKSVVCLNPQAKWILKLIKMLQRKSAVSTP